MFSSLFLAKYFKVRTVSGKSVLRLMETCLPIVVSVLVMATISGCQPSSDTTTTAVATDPAPTTNTGIELSSDAVNCNIPDQLGDPHQPTYWIGVRSRPADSTLCKQLGISCGMIIDEVFKQSPAAENLQPHDVLAGINGEEIRCTKSLVEHINRDPGKILTMSVFRDGQPLEVQITPKPIEQVDGRIVQFLHASDYDKLLGSIPFNESMLDPSAEVDLVLIRPCFSLDSAEKEMGLDCGSNFSIEMSVSFLEDKNGDLLAVVKKDGQVQQFHQGNLDQACNTVRSLIGKVVSQSDRKLATLKSERPSE